MIDEELTKNPQLLLKLMQLSKIKNIEYKNIESIPMGTRSFCFLIKNTEKGKIFVKINAETDSFTFSLRFRESLQIRGKQISEFIEAFNKKQNNDIFIPKEYTTTIIPEKINDLNIPKNLVGKTIEFSEFINAKHLETDRKYKQYNVFCMNFYHTKDVERIFCAIAQFHKFSKEYIKNKKNIEPYFKLKIEKYDNLVQKMNKLLFTLEDNNLNGNLIKALNNFIGNLSKNITSNLDDEIQRLYQELRTKYSFLKNSSFENFDKILFERRNELNKKDTLSGKKLVLLQSIKNLENDSQILGDILEKILNFKEKAKQIANLPELFTHNDVHALNVMLSPDKEKIYLIDFDKAGHNKRIFDMGSVLIINPEPYEKVIKALLNGYRIIGNGHLSLNELKYVYDAWILARMLHFVEDLEDIKNAVMNKNFSFMKKVFNLQAYKKEFEKLEKLSQNNKLPKLLEETQSELYNALHLDKNNGKMNNWQKKVSLRKRSYSMNNYKKTKNAGTNKSPSF